MYTKILVPLDGSETSWLALAHAAPLASWSGATVVVLHCIEELRHTNGFERPGLYLGTIRPGFLAEGRALLDKARQQLQKQQIKTETVMLETGGEQVSKIVLRQAADLAVDLIVLGTHGRRGMNRFWLGSDAERIARGAAVPVMLVRPVATTTTRSAPKSR